MSPTRRWKAWRRHPEPIEAQKAESQGSKEDLSRVVDMLHIYMHDLKAVTADLKAITAEHSKGRATREQGS